MLFRSYYSFWMGWVVVASLESCSAYLRAANYFYLLSAYLSIIYFSILCTYSLSSSVFLVYSYSSLLFLSLYYYSNL